MRGAGITLGLTVALTFGLAAASSTAAADPCSGVQAAIDARVAPTTPAPVLLRLGPHFSSQALSDLLDLGQSGSYARRIASYGAFGLSRYAAGLRRLASSGSPADATGQVAYALASFALGAAKDTGALVQALTEGPIEARRETLMVIRKVRGARARRMLLGVLDDPDAEMRLSAAETLARHGSRRAKRVLVDLLEKGPTGRKARAVEALIGAYHRFDEEEIRRLPPDLGARAYARTKARRTSLDALQTAVLDSDAAIRAGALASAVADDEATADWLAKTEAGAARFGDLGKGERAMTALLLGASSASVIGLEGPARQGALHVLWAFASAPRAALWIDGTTADRAAAAVQAWWTELEEAQRARSLASIGAIDPPAGVRLSRRMLGGIEGPILESAAEILRRYGVPTDAALLIRAADGPMDVARASALASAAALCRLETR